jgi:hypothetical protein
VEDATSNGRNYVFENVTDTLMSVVVRFPDQVFEKITARFDELVSIRVTAIKHSTQSFL